MPAPRFVGDDASWRWAERDSYVRPESPGPYRYLVGRRWGQGPAMLFIALRPGTADARENDPLLENCERRAAMYGQPAVELVALYALRGVQPSAPVTALDPIGPENDAQIVAAARAAGLVVCAWGDAREHAARVDAVVRMLRRERLRLLCLELGGADGRSPLSPLEVPRFGGPLDFGYWPSAPPSEASRRARVVRLSPPQRLTGLNAVDTGSLGGFGLFEPASYRCGTCGIETLVDPRDVPLVAHLQRRRIPPELEHAFHEAFPDDAWWWSVYDFFCSGCQRPVRLAYFEDETYKMSGRWHAALVWVLELREA